MAFLPESESLIQASSPVCWVLKCSSSTSSSLTIVAVVCGLRVMRVIWCNGVVVDVMLYVGLDRGSSSTFVNDEPIFYRRCMP
jgi:hypothetical protein